MRVRVGEFEGFEEFEEFKELRVDERSRSAELQVEVLLFMSLLSDIFEVSDTLRVHRHY